MDIVDIAKEAGFKVRYGDGFVDITHIGEVCNHELTKFAELLLAGQWQPIETAPKDGVRILLWHKDHEPIIGWFMNNRWEKRAGSYIKHTPTHWMPLPQPPKE